MAVSSVANITFQSYQPEFGLVTGTTPTGRVLLEKDYPFAHEAGVFDPLSNSLYVTSNRLKDSHGSSRIEVSRITISGSYQATQDVLDSPSIAMANGGTRYKDGILICDQGNTSASSSLVLMKLAPPHTTSVFVQNFFGTQFNSPNDVVVHSDGSVWFTDPTYGHEQGFRPLPSLPNQVYRYDPQSKDIRAIADGFGHPNGLAFSPNERTLYITDTDSARGDGGTDKTRPATIYAFDVITYSNQSFLTNRRLFAISDNGVPDGIKVDTRGNVYAGCGDGIHVWSPGGVLLGKILIPGGIANFCFGKGSDIFALGETKLWLVGMGPGTQGVGA